MERIMLFAVTDAASHIKLNMAAEKNLKLLGC
jgi:hypothetical protein